MRRKYKVTSFGQGGKPVRSLLIPACSYQEALRIGGARMPGKHAISEQGQPIRVLGVRVA